MYLPRAMAGVVACVLLAAAAAAAGEPAAPGESDGRRFEYAQVHMGVRVRLVVFAGNQDLGERACRAAFARLAELEQIMSDYRPDSELMRLCASAGGEPTAVSDDLLAVLERAVEVSRQSNGAFDITVGPLVRMWREARKTGRLPAAGDLESARRLVGWDKVQIDRAARTVRLAEPGMQLDLGGIAKGYAGDQALAVLKAHGVPAALYEAGGDIVAGDAPADAPDGWAIEVPDPAAAGGRRTVPLSRAAVSTSGDSEQFVLIDGVRYSHIVDPRTGVGLTDGALVSVIGPDGLTCDSLSTAISVLGPVEGEVLAARYPQCTVTIAQQRQPTTQREPGQ